MVETKKQGFTIVELLIVIIIIAILGVIALPQFLNAQDRGKQSQTVANLRNVANSLSLYHADNNQYPTANTVALLKTALEPVYMERMPTQDGWNNAFFIDAASDTYTFGSCGKQTTACNALTIINSGDGGVISTFEEDIVIRDGSFIQYPAGTQQ